MSLFKKKSVLPLHLKLGKGIKHKQLFCLETFSSPVRDQNAEERSHLLNNECQRGKININENPNNTGKTTNIWNTERKLDTADFWSKSLNMPGNFSYVFCLF